MEQAKRCLQNLSPPLSLSQSHHLSDAVPPLIIFDSQLIQLDEKSSSSSSSSSSQNCVWKNMKAAKTRTLLALLSLCVFSVAGSASSSLPKDPFVGIAPEGLWILFDRQLLLVLPPFFRFGRNGFVHFLSACFDESLSSFWFLRFEVLRVVGCDQVQGRIEEVR